jgi:hypothetical protein
LTLGCFVASKEILIDASGWGDILLGVVVCAVKPPNPMIMERRIPTSSFQPPQFKDKKYFDDAVKIADEIVTVMQPDKNTCIKVSSEYILSEVRKHLINCGFNVRKVENTGELKNMVDKAYLRWCAEVGVPEERLKKERRFWSLLEWVAQNPKLREGLVKTGWASWQRRWRDEIYHTSLRKLG